MVNTVVEDNDRVIAREELEVFREQHRQDKIAFTNGCFDLIHIGHVTLLERASGLGDFLVVGVNSDDSVRNLKGEGRPLMRLEERVSILLALEVVGYVTVFEENTPLKTIELLKPDILVKGAEYKTDEIVGAEVVRNNGGKVVRVEMVGEKSTTALINRIKELKTGSEERSDDCK